MERSMELTQPVQDRIDLLKREVFLQRIVEVSQGDTRREVPVGLLGQELGLPYGEALAIVDQLSEAGWIERPGGEPLDPPDGPRVHVLPEGLSRARVGSAQARA
jgi:hypothetical protein